MKTAAPLLQRRCACGKSASTDEKCPECEKKLQRKPAGPAQANVAPQIVHEVLASPGQPLDLQTRAFMEPRFGHDFGKVRVHTDGKAAESARAVNALAYTVGSHIAFGTANHSPAEISGRRLLAHELCHVIQQDSASGTGPIRVIAADHQSETEADSISGDVAEERSIADIGIRTSGAVLQRFAGPETPLKPNQIGEFRALIQQFMTMARAGAVATGESQAIQAAITDAESAIATAEEIAAAGTALISAGETATAAAGVLAADDVTGVGVADDVAIPFVLLGAAALFGVGYLVGNSSGQIAVAWNRAADAVARATRLLRETVSTRRPVPVPTRTRPQINTTSKESSQPEPRRRPKPFPPIGPDIDFEEETSSRCTGKAIAQRGGHTCHDQFATFVSGVTREWAVQTPEGLYETYDALARDRTLYEVKTGYRFLLSTAESTRALREHTIHKFVDQSQSQFAVATRCGYQLVWMFNDRDVATLVNSHIQPTVLAKDFPCDQDG